MIKFTLLNDIFKNKDKQLEGAKWETNSKAN